MKDTLMAVAIIIALTTLLMPALVRAPQTIEQQPGIDPARPH